jgi:phosphoserine aminotransferase
MMAAYASKTGKVGKADYVVTGSWSQKASEEAKRLGLDVNIVVNAKSTSQSGKYGSIPPQSDWKFSKPEDTAFVYYCDNETVNGVEFQFVPEVPEGVELVADMSSNILSRPFDVSKFGLIFAGAQKNIGIAGVSVYIIKKTLLDRVSDEKLRDLGLPLVPIFLDFPTIVKNNSAYNTISIFAVHIVGLTVEHLIKRGGLEYQANESEAKAQKVYEVIDKHPKLYVASVERSCRSRMNIVFNIAGSDTIEKEFLDRAQERGLTGLKGHRSVGGIRVSNCK